MKATLASLTVGVLLMTLNSSAQNTKPDVLVSEDFNTPTGLTLDYPPSSGTNFKRFNPTFSAWASKGGQIAVTYADKIGMNDSGGISLSVAKKTGKNGFLAVTCESLKLPIASADQIGSCLKSLTIEFSIKIPVGKHISLFLVPDEKTLPEDLKSKSWGSKVAVAVILGNDQYQQVSLKGADLNPEVLQPMTRLLTDCFKQGASGIAFNLLWHMGGDEWSEGEGLSLDDVKIALNPVP